MLFICVLELSLAFLLHHMRCNKILDSQAVLPHTVESFDKDAYMGRWYQMYTSLIPNQTFQRDGYCITADHHTCPEHNHAFMLINSLRFVCIEY
jgi:hypothetical protein